MPEAPTAGVTQVQPAGLTSEAKVVPAGRVFVRTSAVAASGPAFVTVIAYVRPAPGKTGSGASVIVTETPADARAAAWT